VVSSASQPSFANASVAGNNFVCKVTDGPPGSTGYILESTDLRLPKTAWTRIATSVFDMSGNFHLHQRARRQWRRHTVIGDPGRACPRDEIEETMKPLLSYGLRANPWLG